MKWFDKKEFSSEASNEARVVFPVPGVPVMRMFGSWRVGVGGGFIEMLFNFKKRKTICLKREWMGVRG